MNVKMSIAVRMYKGKQQIYDGTQCIDGCDPGKIKDWFNDLCETTMGDDMDDVVKARYSDVVTMDMEQDLYNMEIISAYTLENGLRYVMLGYVKFYDEES